MSQGPQPVRRREERLSSWKEIAAYLDRDVRTVQRWEASRGMPVHRLPGKGRSPIYALASELDEWWAGSPAEEAPATPPVRHRSRLRWYWLGAFAAGAAALAAWIPLRSRQPPAPLPVVPLTSLPGTEHGPALSPDGRRLAFSWQPPDARSTDLYLIDLPDGAPRRLTDHPDFETFAEWSPDGHRLAYVRIAGGGNRFELRLLDLRDGSDRLLLTSPVPATDVPPWLHTWTPGGEGLILGRPRHPGGPFGMTFHNLQTGNEQGLTTPVSAMTGEVTPTLSPDGRRLVFQRRILSGEGDLFIVDLEPGYKPAGPPRQLTHEGCCLHAPSWTRDGREVVFVSWKDGTRRLARIPAGGGAVRYDPRVPSPGFSPRVAPDGRLVFHDSVLSVNIFRVDLAEPESGAKKLISSSRRDGSPAYSSDGRQIAFISDRTGSCQLFVCDREGGPARQLTRLEDGSAWYPAWSPDGRWIAFEGRRGNQADIYLVSPATGQVRPLIRSEETEQHPIWSRDGRRLYFASDRTGRYEVWRVGIDREGRAGDPVQVTKNGGYAAYESPDGRFLYISDWTQRELRRMPIEGGAEEKVFGAAPMDRFPANLASGGKGIYFLGQAGAQGTPVWFVPFAGGPPRLLETERRKPSAFGIAVSPDDRFLLLSAVEQSSGDILSVPRFR